MHVKGSRVLVAKMRERVNWPKIGQYWLCALLGACEAPASGLPPSGPDGACATTIDGGPGFASISGKFHGDAPNAVSASTSLHGIDGGTSFRYVAIDSAPDSCLLEERFARA